MDLNALAQYSEQVAAMINPKAARDLDQALESLADAGQWDILGQVLPTASEVAARRIVDRLIQQGEYDWLASAACLRRQLRQPGREAPAGRMARQVFRDIDAEEDTEGIPEHIMEEAQELANAAAARRAISERQATQIDRDPVRELIVERLASCLPEQRAGEALLVVAKGCPFDQTRRQAAIKLVNHKQWIRQLVAAKRTTDLIAVSESARLKAVLANAARLLGEQVAELQQAGDHAALRFIAEHHPNGEIRQQAHDALA